MIRQLAAAAGLLLSPGTWGQALSLVPNYGAGPTAEFLIQTQSPVIVLIINTTLNGNGACYMSIDAVTPAVWVRRDSTKEWGPGGDRCGVTVKPYENGVRVRVVFLGAWTGEQTVYVMERPGELWYRGGVWTVDNNSIPWLPPMPPPAGGNGPPGPAGDIGSTGATGAMGPPAPLLRMVTETIRLELIPKSPSQTTHEYRLAFAPAPSTLVLADYHSDVWWARRLTALTAFNQIVQVPINGVRTVWPNDVLLLIYWTLEPTTAAPAPAPALAPAPAPVPVPVPPPPAL